MSIIDFRLRVPYKSNKDMFVPENSWAERIGFETPESVKQASFDLTKKELKEAGIDIGVVHGRLPHAVLPEIKNEDVASLVQEYPGQFYGLAVVNPNNGSEIQEVVDKYIATGILKGLTFEPTLVPDDTYDLDSVQTYKVYEQAKKYDVPVLITYGGGGIPKNEADSLKQLRRALEDFPTVNIVLGHGGWPFVNEVSQLAFFHKNLFLSPDLYSTYFPGSLDYFVAANHGLQDQIIFGTAYPFVPIKGVTDLYRERITDPVIFEKVTYKNAAKLLKIEK